jgi:hypothetical protein
MSIPSIPGFMGSSSDTSLATLWSRPKGEFPPSLWPQESLATVSPSPSGWLELQSHGFTSSKHGGRSCVLVAASHSAKAFEQNSWIGRSLGNVEVWDDGSFEDGLTTDAAGIDAEFFVQVRNASGAKLPLVEVSLPFLWYWDAFPVSSGWAYLNRAGKEQPLVRYEAQRDRWLVEVRALEFRQYLAAKKMSALVQIDTVLKSDNEPFDRIDATFKTQWADFSFHVLYDESMTRSPAFSRLLGQYVITGLNNIRVPRHIEREMDRDYPEFVYRVDPATGMHLKHTCDPDLLGTYFDTDNSRLHYLTPIYFRRDVLQPYTSEPTKYEVSSSRLSCLDLWSVEISFNSAGLVEVYLGDIGRDLPADEWGHWLSCNVPPEGRMDEGRFRRDFLNQWASSKDHTGDLRRARSNAAEVSTKLLGTPLWRQLSGNIEAEFRSLIAPLNEDAASLSHPILILTKALVDGIDPKPLKAYLSDAEKGDQSLQLLRRFELALGSSGDVTAILRDLQSFRSKGGVAHLAGSSAAQTAKVLGIDGLSNIDAFDSVVTRATLCLSTLTGLMSEAIQELSAVDTE